MRQNKVSEQAKVRRCTKSINWGRQRAKFWVTCFLFLLSSNTFCGNVDPVLTCIWQININWTLLTITEYKAWYWLIQNTKHQLVIRWVCTCVMGIEVLSGHVGRLHVVMATVVGDRFQLRHNRNDRPSRGHRILCGFAFKMMTAVQHHVVRSLWELWIVWNTV